MSQHYNTIWCPEYAREYLTKYGRDYSYDDLLTIAKGQVELEEQYVSKILRAEQTSPKAHSPFTTHHSPLFIDTDMYVMKVWCEYAFGKCHQFILDQIAKRKYDLYFLCNIDLPWSYDPLREYPDEGPRKELYQIYSDILINQETPWVEISGSYDERFETATSAVDNLLRIEQEAQVSDTTKADSSNKLVNKNQ